MKALVYIAGIFIVVTINGWILSIIWSWFFVTTLSLPVISIPEAIGIALVVAFLTHQYTDEEEDTTVEEFFEQLFKSIFRSLLFLFMAWVVTSFM